LRGRFRPFRARFVRPGSPSPLGLSRSAPGESGQSQTDAEHGARTSNTKGGPATSRSRAATIMRRCPLPAARGRGGRAARPCRLRVDPWTGLHLLFVSPAHAPCAAGQCRCDCEGLVALSCAHQEAARQQSSFRRLRRCPVSTLPAAPGKPPNATARRRSPYRDHQRQLVDLYEERNCRAAQV